MLSLENTESMEHIYIHFEAKKMDEKLTFFCCLMSENSVGEYWSRKFGSRQKKNIIFWPKKQYFMAQNIWLIGHFISMPKRDVLRE